MDSFKKLYLWSMNAKFYMGIYFIAIVFLAGIMMAVLGKDSLSLLVLLEMFGVSLAIALVQVVVLPASVDLTRQLFTGRTIGWLLYAGVLTVVVSVIGGWFAGLPVWCSYLLGVLMLLGCMAMLVGIRFEQDADTCRLNDSMKAYQGKK